MRGLLPPHKRFFEEYKLFRKDGWLCICFSGVCKMDT